MSRSLSPARIALGAATTLGAVALGWTLEARLRGSRTALMHRTMVELLLNTLCAGDPSTARHSRRVADLTDAVGQTFRMTREDRARLRIAALLHDLGKLDDSVSPIVHSDHRLNDSERDTLEEHTNESANILEPLETVHPGISAIVKSHHERWDGRGYPKGLSGTEIPLESRIISVADVFDALTEPRSYRDPMSVDEALEEIRRDAGSKFDPTVVERTNRPEVWREWIRVVQEGRRDEDRIAAADGSSSKASG